MTQKYEQFQKHIEALVEQVKTWAEPHEWVTKEYPKKLRDGAGQLFVTPSLFLQRGPVRVLLDPIAYDVPGSDAVVDLYLMPSYDDLASLYLANGQWTIHYPLVPDTVETQSENGTKSLAIKRRDDQPGFGLDRRPRRIVDLTGTNTSRTSRRNTRRRASPSIG